MHLSLCRRVWKHHLTHQLNRVVGVLSTPTTAVAPYPKILDHPTIVLSFLKVAIL